MERVGGEEGWRGRKEEGKCVCVCLIACCMMQILNSFETDSNVKNVPCLGVASNQPFSCTVYPHVCLFRLKGCYDTIFHFEWNNEGHSC